MTRVILTRAAFVTAIILSSSVSAQTTLPNLGSQSPQPVPLTPPGNTAPTATSQPASPFPSARPPVMAQPLGRQTDMTGTPVALSPSTGQSQPQAPANIPVSETVKKQAVYQSEGVYPPMDRTGAGGGQIQEAWNLSDMHEGIYSSRMCGDCVYKVRVREFMTTTLVLPEDAIVTSADLGDTTGFKVQVRSNNKIIVRPNTYGIDTNLTVFTKSGAIYPFYIRSESFNSIYVPDLVVKIIGRESLDPIEGVGDDKKDESKPKKGAKSSSIIDGLTTPKAAKGDFVRNVPFDPSKLHGFSDYKLSGGGDGYEDLKPELIYRDDFFTYIKYGDKWDGMELSSAYVTIDGIDELVNSRVQGNTFIVESVAPLVTLKNGKRFLCVKYVGEKP